MTSSEQLQMLKKNLQQLSSANDDFLIHLLEQAERRFTIMGIVKEEGGQEYEDALIDMAAYLFRARDRAGASNGISDSEMPRFLRKELNDLKLHQQAERAKAGGDDDDV